MASAVIHICVAKRLNSYLKMDEKKLFLGSIAPDISKQLGKSKNKSHFLKGNDETSEPDIKKFIDKYKSELTKPFEMGYLIHLLTDKYWFRDYIDTFLNEYSIKQYGRKMTYDELRDIIYNDYSNINITLIDKYELSLDLFSNYWEYPKSKIDEIPMDQIDVIVRKMGIIIQNSKNAPIFIFNIDQIVDFIESVALKILNILKKYSLYEFKVGV